MLPLISIILPVYNMSGKLPRCIASLTAQTYPNLEFLFVDDGSTDNSVQVIQQYADSRFRILRKKNGGVSSARNEGLRNMRGEYGAFVDPDDTVSPNYIQYLYDALMAQGTKMSCCWTYELHEDDVDKPLPDEPHQPAKLATFDNYDQWGEMAHVQSYGVLYHHDLLENLRFDEQISYAEDTLFYMQAVLATKRVAYLIDRLYYYVQWTGSAMHQKYTTKQYSDVTVWADVCRMTKDVAPLMHQTSMTRYCFARTRAFYFSFTSEQDCTALRQDAIKRLRANWRWVLKMPTQNERRKGLIAMVSPKLAYLMWKKAKGK